MTKGTRYGAHSMCRTKAIAAQSWVRSAAVGRHKIENAERYLGIEVENVLEMTGQRSFLTDINWSGRGAVAIEGSATLQTIGC